MARPPRDYPARPIVGVGAVIVVGAAEARVLELPDLPPCGVVLVRRRFPPLAGEWSLPGGMLELGEQVQAGVARETLEETGLIVDVGPVVEVCDRIVFDPDGRVQYHFVLIDYLCRPAGGRLQAASDAAGVVIADAAGLAAFCLTAEADAVIRRALAMAHGPGDPRSCVCGSRVDKRMSRI